MSRAKEQTIEAAAADERLRFLEMVRREVRTPLNGITAVAGLLARQPLTPDAQAYVRTIVDSSASLLRRIDEALDLAQGQCGGAVSLAKDTISLRQLMDEVQQDWQARTSPGVSLSVSYDGEPHLEVVTDAARLRQLFDCLVSAALDVTSRGGVEVSLRARADGEAIRMEGRVRDCGRMLNAHEAEHLFDEDYESSREVPLRLCRQTILALGGDVRAEANIGAGSTITFAFRAARAEAEAAPAQEEANNGGGAHVLVVDDNATNRMVAQSLCEMFNCTSEAVEDGVEAVEAAKTGRYDVILMDIKMPRMDGVSATREIRAMPGFAGAAPIIALT
ncbi:MAG: hybrid sensor histidine kinase/response regulator, partial [Caulobacteraceae bacterium]